MRKQILAIVAALAALAGVSVTFSDEFLASCDSEQHASDAGVASDAASDEDAGAQ